MTTPSSIVCELLKLLRSQWLDCEAIVRETRLCEGTVRRWTGDLAQQGILSMRMGRSAKNRPVPQFAVAKSWGGVA